MNDDLEITPEESPEESEKLTTEEPSRLHNTFKNPFGHLRAGWRMLIHWLILLAIAGPTNYLLHSIRNSIPGGKGIHSPRFIVLYIGMVAAFTFAAYLTLKYADKRPFRTLGFWFSPGWFKEYSIGLGFGFGPITLIFFILWGANLLDVSKGVWDITLLFFLLKMLLLFALAGTFEELMLRGYFFQALIEGTNKWIAMIVFSLIFSILHMFNPNWSAMGAIMIFLSGFELAIAYIKTRSLWLPIGMHMAWNWSQGPLWGMNVSGTTMETSVLVSVPQGPEFWSGGQFGAEGSAITIAVSLLTIWIIWSADWIKPSDANIALWNKYPASYGVPPEED
ncbi:CPBP family intramembrane metalloprotease [Candidatus Marinimicrobia bacterium MT.SAG.3]|nr:CPBP family intramembrane metalloprotease [Candidatus Marinimicrobia bacterium MT.SAG.3]